MVTVTACDYPPVSCETCQDTGWISTIVYIGPRGDREYADQRCPTCDGQTPTFLPGVDDVLEGTREGWDR